MSGSFPMSAGERLELRRKARLLILLHAAEQAGVAPIRVLPLHAFAYLANVLAPVWDMPAQEGRILKRKGGPFYPEMQSDLDRLVGVGLVKISGVGHSRAEGGDWRLDGSYRLNLPMARAALVFLSEQPDEQRVEAFILELAFAISALPRWDLESALVEDATYSDPTTGENNVLDFGEWAVRNPSASAARYFEQLQPQHLGRITPGEKLHLYIRHLYRRVNVS